MAMQKGERSGSPHIGQERRHFSVRANMSLLLLISLASVVYLFDSIVYRMLPASAVENAPAIFQSVFNSFSSPTLLLLIYLSSIMELIVLFKAYPRIKKFLTLR